jgi:hypothetical protein
MSETATTRRNGRTTPVRSHGTDHLVPTLELAGIAGLATMIAIHATELAGKVEEVAYLGFGYVALIAASFVAVVMLAVGDRRGWALAGATAAATLIGYVLTRTTGLPGSTDDVGNWGETLAIWAMVAELGVCGLAAAALRRPRRA